MAARTVRAVSSRILSLWVGIGVSRAVVSAHIVEDLVDIFLQFPVVFGRGTAGSLARIAVEMSFGSERGRVALVEAGVADAGAAGLATAVSTLVLLHAMTSGSGRRGRRIRGRFWRETAWMEQEWDNNPPDGGEGGPSQGENVLVSQDGIGPQGG